MSSPPPATTLPTTPARGDQPEQATLSYVQQAVVEVSKPLQGEFGDYELLEEVARGGMGVVFKARQKGLNRIVALKMILPGKLARPEDLQRFRTEAEATARLQHANIVTVHEVGEVDGQHFYSMDFIEGPSLSKRLAHGPLPGRLAARLVMTAADAIYHAHSHGILHRDLKPSNILLDAQEEPHITDFGLAKKLDCDSSQTRTGLVMGTPSYMAPEQAAGKVKELGPACDVYGLGAVLYELLTGRPPFHSDTAMDTLAHVLERDPAPPRLLNPKVDRDLETICLKCLEKDPRNRYGSAAALAQDLKHYLAGESISASSFNVLDRLARTLDRSPHAIEFRTWGQMLLWCGVVVFLGHFITFLLVEAGQPPPLRWLARGGQFVVLGMLFWHYRGARSLLPTSAAERQLWSIWIAYLAAFTASWLISRELVPPGQHWNDWEELRVYPFSAILTGLAFFAMGSNYWGQCYAIGLAFIGLAALMPLNLYWAPLAFGVFWSVAFVLLGLHVRRIGREAGADPDGEALQAGGNACLAADREEDK
jgi:tRNA A-37 threonylcarbamoyl transferase component Bud32